eukprot:212639_1
MPRKKLTRAEVLSNRKRDIFINDHCRICKYTFKNNIVWTDHKDTIKHTKARQRLLDSLPKRGKRSYSGSGGPKEKRQKVTTTALPNHCRQLPRKMIWKNSFPFKFMVHNAPLKTSEPMKQWKCSLCTLVNSATVSKCQVCGQTKPGVNISPSSPPVSIQKEDKDSKIDVNEERKNDVNDNSNNECVICLEKNREFICVPCGHLCLCKECKDLINQKCPICRAKSTVMKIYK